MVYLSYQMKKKSTIKAADFDNKFDRGDDISTFVDPSSASLGANPPPCNAGIDSAVSRARLRRE